MSEEKKLTNEITFGEGEDMFEEAGEEEAADNEGIKVHDFYNPDELTATVTTSVPGELIIPMDRVEEFKYLSKGNYCQVLCSGVMTERGMVVQDVKYKR